MRLSEAPAPAGTQPGWYADPLEVGAARYWDGDKWSKHYRDAPGPDPLPVEGGAEASVPPGPAHRRKDLLGEGIAAVLGAVVPGLDSDDAAQMKERLRSGFPAAEFTRAGGRALRELEDGRYQDIQAGELAGTQLIEVLGERVEIGIPSGWASRDAAERGRMPESSADTSVCAALYRPDADPTLAYALLVLTIRGRVQEEQQRPDPALWLLGVEQQTGLRASTPAMCARLGGEVSFVWHLAGAMSGAALGRAQEVMIAVQSSELWCPRVGGMVKLWLVAPPEKRQEGQQAFASLIGSWRWLRA